MKLRIGLTIDGETLFGLIAKMLPVEDVSVEELPPVKAERAARIAAPRKQKRASSGPDLKKGVNGIILIALQDGPKRAAELQPLAKAAGFSPNSINSRLEGLRRHKVVERIGDGRWKLND